MRFRINPEFSYRVTTQEILDHYGGLDRAYAAGDYMLVASHAPEGSELQGRALVLGGLIGKGARVLDSRQTLSDEGKVVRTLAWWLQGETGKASAMLESLGAGDSSGFKLAGELLRLIRAERINVFKLISAVPIHFDEEDHHRSRKHAFGQFVVSEISGQMEHKGTAGEAPKYNFNDPLDAYVDALPESERPEFLYAQTPQWILPKNYEKVRVPKVMWCNDTDVFLYAYGDNYRLQDVHIHNASHEHFELSRISGVWGVSNFISDPTVVPFSDVGWSGEKDIDVLFTGDAFHKYFTERARFLFHLAKLGDRFKIRIQNGHVPGGKYRELLERAGFVPMINRYLGMPSPRWRDALSAGAFLLAPEGSFFDTASPGAFTVREDSLEADTEAHLSRYRREKDREGSPLNPKELAPKIAESLKALGLAKDQAESQLKYAAFFALQAKTLGVGRIKAEGKRRVVWLTPLADMGIWGDGHVKNRIASAVGEPGGEDDWDEKDYNNAACTFGKLAVMSDEKKLGDVDGFRKKRDGFFSSGLERFPDSLILNFNMCFWRFVEVDGHSNDDIENAKEGFETFLNRLDSLSFDPFGSDVGSGIASLSPEIMILFPYFEYASLVMEWAVCDATPSLAHKLPPDNPKEVFRAAAQAFVGLCILLRDNGTAGYEACVDAARWFGRSDETYGRNPELKRLLIDTLANLARSGKSDQDIHNRLIEGFFSAVNLNPGMLLGKELLYAVDSCMQLQRVDLAERLFEEWYGFARTMHAVPQKGRDGLERDFLERMLFMQRLLSYAPYLPGALLEKVNDWQRGEGDLTSAPTVEVDLAACLAKFGRVPHQSVPGWDRYLQVFGELDEIAGRETG